MPTTTKGRVLTPKNPKENFELAGKIFAKHQADGATSELKNLDGYDWTVDGPNAAAGLKKHMEAEELKGKMEAAYRERDVINVKIDGINKATSSYLKGKYAKNPKKLAEWGFTIDDSVKAKKPAVTV